MYQKLLGLNLQRNGKEVLVSNGDLWEFYFVFFLGVFFLLIFLYENINLLKSLIPEVLEKYVK